MTKNATKKTSGFSFSFLHFNLLILLLIIISTGLGIYFFHFKRQPIDQILASNQALNTLLKPRFSGLVDREEVSSGEAWDAWVAEKGLVAIGNVYDSCNDSRRVHIGRVVMKQNPLTHSLVTETLFNVTLDHDLQYGTMHMSTDMNGLRLITREWSLCKEPHNTHSDQLVVDCPVKKGLNHFAKEKNIPSYLPKGRYTVKMWATDEHEKVIVCGVSELAL